jgi:hypothetical protein
LTQRAILLKRLKAAEIGKLTFACVSFRIRHEPVVHICRDERRLSTEAVDLNPPRGHRQGASELAFPISEERARKLPVVG